MKPKKEWSDEGPFVYESLAAESALEIFLDCQEYKENSTCPKSYCSQGCSDQGEDSAQTHCRTESYDGYDEVSDVS